MDNVIRLPAGCEHTGWTDDPDGGQTCASCGERLAEPGDPVVAWMGSLPVLCVAGDPDGCGCPKCMPTAAWNMQGPTAHGHA